MQFEVDRLDFHHTRFVESASLDELTDEHIVLELESFAFTANNITYAVAGDMLDYWGFFPAEAPWGRIPVMGIGRVTHSTQEAIPVGGRYFGFYPMADHHVLVASPAREGFVDRSPHRTNHAPAYRSFNRVDDDPAYDPATEGQYLVARGLFITSFLVDDFLGQHDGFGAAVVLVTSASSRTSLALAHRLRARGGVHVVGLTSASNRDFVEQVGLYDHVLLYNDIETLDAAAPSVLVDMAGNADVLSRIHHHYGDQLRHSCRVGATHHDAGGDVSGLPGPPPAFFFAPAQIKVRSAEWGRDEFDARLGAALAGFIQDATGWMTIQRGEGDAAVDTVYRSTLDGANDPSVGHVLSLGA